MTSRDLIQVPNLSAAELVAQAQKDLNPTRFYDGLLKWDFITDEAGKTYEVQVWRPGRESVSITEVREHFRDGFAGNTAAFIAWAAKTNPAGYHVTIPADGKLFQGGGCLSVPLWIGSWDHRELGLVQVDQSGWSVLWAFAAFREVKVA